MFIMFKYLQILQVLCSLNSESYQVIYEETRSAEMSSKQNGLNGINFKLYDLK